MPPTPPDRRDETETNRFVRTEIAGGALVIVATLLALGWANLPGAGYAHFWGATGRLGLTGWRSSPRAFVNDGTMTLFFLAVGLELRREVAEGALRSWRRAAVPVAAAVGGMAGSALVYLAVTAGTPSRRGWGIPMATDLALALGCLALVHRGRPSPVRLLLLSLAVVDDLGSVVVLAAFYGRPPEEVALAGAFATVGVLVLCRVWSRLSWPTFLVLGVVLWALLDRAGVEPALAGVVLGLCPPGDGASADRFEEICHPWSGLLVVPLFALANAGIPLGAAALDPTGHSRVFVGVVAAKVLGKFLGVVGATLLVVRLRLGSLPPGMGARELAGLGALSGIGLTVSFLVAGVAFTDSLRQNQAKAGVLVAALLTAAVGAWLLRTRASSRTASGPAAPR